MSDTPAVRPSFRLPNKLLAAGTCIAALIACNTSFAQTNMKSCKDKYPGKDNLSRLHCFDRVLEQQSTVSALTPAITPANSGSSVTPSHPATRGLLAEWNMAANTQSEWGIQPHRLTYLMLASKTNDRNQQPSSPTPGHTVTTPYGWSPTEVKFQFSIKSEIVGWDSNVMGLFDRSRLWFAYTQQSTWQAFNFSKSSPFRENNYEPELIASFKPIGAESPDARLKVVNIGFNHQSNGRSQPDSRSWWRVYAQSGWEVPAGKHSLSLLGRVWGRLPEKPATDDNPDIKHFIGRADLVATLDDDRDSTWTLLIRNNLNVGRNRGFVQVDWRGGNLAGGSVRPYVQVTNGYGESLIDYNFRQWTIGGGFAFELGK